MSSHTTGRSSDRGAANKPVTGSGTRLGVGVLRGLEAAPFLAVVSRFGAASAVSLVVGLIRQRLLASFLGPSGLGFMAAAARLQESGSTVASFGTGPGVTDLVARTRERNHGLTLQDVLGTALLIGVTTAMAAALAFGGARTALAHGVFGQADARWAVLAVAAGLPFLGVASILVRALNGLQDFSALALHNVLVVSGSLLLLAALTARFDLAGAVASYPAGAVLSALIAALLLHRRLLAVSGRSLLSMLGAGRRSIAKALFGLGGVSYYDTLLSSGAALVTTGLVINECGLAQNGFFQAAQGVSRLYLGFFLSGIASYLVPHLAVASNLKRLFSEQDRTLRATLLIVVPISGVVVILRAPLTRVLLGDGFAPVAGLLAISAPADILHAAIWVIGASFLPTRNLKAYAASATVSAVTLLLLSWALVADYGAEGAIMAYALGRLLTFIFVVGVQRAILGYHINRISAALLVTGVALQILLGLMTTDSDVVLQLGAFGVLLTWWLAGVRICSRGTQQEVA